MSVFEVTHDNSESNQSRNMKWGYTVLYKHISDKFDNGHFRIKVKVTVGLSNFSPFTQYKLSGPITQIWYKLGSLY